MKCKEQDYLLTKVVSFATAYTTFECNGLVQAKYTTCNCPFTVCILYGPGPGPINTGVWWRSDDDQGSDEDLMLILSSDHDQWCSENVQGLWTRLSGAPKMMPLWKHFVFLVDPLKKIVVYKSDNLFFANPK